MPISHKKSLIILGTRGIPAAHGGFETFAEQLALYLVNRGWHVAVYCQNDVDTVTQLKTIDNWRGVERITFQVARKGAVGTLDFDWRCIVDAGKRDSVCLVLGYNSAVFLPYLRLCGRKILTNMDGIEWRRGKWSKPVQAWFWVNEWIAAWSSHRLIADHPAIADHLATRRSRRMTVTIPYGGDPVHAAPVAPIQQFGLTPDEYLVSIARIEQENNILPMVQAFVRRKRSCKLVILGKVETENPYHRAVKEAANEAVLFPGAIYEAETVRALRFHARAYMHGHTVGGTNPSLVEALWAGNAVIAHDNAFNRWTAGDGQFFFANVESCDEAITAVSNDETAVATARSAARDRAIAAFGWPDVLEAYEKTFIAFGDFASPVARAEPARTARV